MSEELQVMYQDFNICRKCDAVLMKSEKQCTKCGYDKFIPFEEQIEKLGSVRGGIGCVVAILALVVGVASAGPLGLFLALPVFWIGKALNTNGNNAKKARKIRYMNEATKLLRERASQQKFDIISNYKIGSQYFVEENFPKAISLFEKGLSLGDTSKMLLYKLAISYYNNEQYDQALPLLEDLAEDADLPHVKELLARNIIKLGITADRLDQLKLLKASISKREAQHHITLAIADYYYANQADAAQDIDLISTALNLRPTEPRYLEIMLNYLVASGRVEEAIDLCLDFPWEYHSKETVLIWARAYNSIREISDMAIKVYTRAVQDHPGDMDIRVALSEALVGEGRYDTALQVTTEGLDINEDIRLQHLLALIYLLTDQIEPSIAAYQKLMKMDNFESYIAKSVIYRQLSTCFIKMNRLDLAYKQLMLADRSKPSLDQLYKLSELFYQNGDVKKALACLEEIYATDVNYKDVSQKIKAWDKGTGSVSHQ